MVPVKQEEDLFSFIRSNEYDICMELKFSKIITTNFVYPFITAKCGQVSELGCQILTS